MQHIRGKKRVFTDITNRPKDSHLYVETLDKKPKAHDIKHKIKHVVVEKDVGKDEKHDQSMVWNNLKEQDSSQCPQIKPFLGLQDKRNHLEVWQYAEEIHKNALNIEIMFLPYHDYLSCQAFITKTMRSILIDWLTDVQVRFDLQSETLHLCVNIIDRYCGKTSVLKDELQLVGLAALFIASKFQEIGGPRLRCYSYISDNSCTPAQIIETERKILAKLCFKLCSPSSLTFMNRCLKIIESLGVKEEVHQFLVEYILDLSLIRSSLLGYRPSLKAALACQLAASYCGVHILWDEAMDLYCGEWSKREFLTCKQAMSTLVEDDRRTENKFTAVNRKFAKSKYLRVSKMDLMNI